MIQYEVSAFIQRSPAEVYDYVAVNQVTNHPKWEDEVLKVRRPGTLEVGQKGIMVRKDGNRIREVPFEITHLIPDRLMAVKSGLGGYNIRLVFDMKPHDGGTLFHTTVTLKLTGFMWLLTPIFKRDFPKISARITNKLADLLNNQVSA